MQNTISKVAKNEVLGALRGRYQQTSKQEKSKILDEFVAVAGCHRKHAIRLLAPLRPTESEAPAVNRRTYDEAVRAVERGRFSSAATPRATGHDPPAGQPFPQGLRLPQRSASPGH
jgi:hypothetical protein